MQKQEHPPEALSYTDRIGLRGFTHGELDAMSHAFSQELTGGLESPQHLTSLKMIDTLLNPISQQTLDAHAGEEVLVLEIGGTNVYGAWLRNEKILGPEIMTNGSRPLEMRKELTTRHFDSPQAFFTEVIGGMEDFIRSRPIQKIGVVYTFPAEAVKTDLGIDAMSPDKLPKDFFINGIHEQPVGQTMVQYMKEQKIDVRGLSSLVVLNDTPAALLSGHDSKIGGIVGTGFNFAMMTQGRIYNLESGGFASVPQHGLARAVDMMSDNPGQQLAEKQISGLYLGRQLTAAINDLRNAGMGIWTVRKEDLGAEVVSHILNEDWVEVFQRVRWDLKIRGTEELLRKIARPLRLRSAQLVALQLSTIVNTFSKEFSDVDRIEIPVEGSVFWGIPEYRNLVTIFAQSATSKDFSFSGRPHAGARGAAAAAIGLLG